MAQILIHNDGTNPTQVPEATFAKQLALISCFFTWLACVVTPTCIGILQAFDMSNIVVQLGMMCDIFFCLQANEGRILMRLHRLVKKMDVSRLWKSKGAPKMQWPRRKALSSLEAMKQGGVSFPSPRVFVYIMHSLLPLVTPLVARSLGASDLMQAWFTVFRMIRVRDLIVICNTLKYKFSDVAALHNDTFNRCIITAVLTSIHASSLAAVWFYISCRRQNMCSSEQDDSWVVRDEILRENDTFSIYIRSMHFVIQTLFTVGYGDINIVTNKEYFFALFLILNGSLYYAFLISCITSLLSNKDVSTKMFRTDLANCLELLQVCDAPEDLRLCITEFFYYSLARQCGCSENIFLEDVPILLLKEIKHTYAEQLQRLPFFKTLSETFAELCAERLTYRTYVPASVVFSQGERGLREVILVQSGKIDLCVGNEKATLFTYLAGDSLGDYQLIFGNPSEVTAKANTFTEVTVLSLEAFSEAARLYNLSTSMSATEWLASQTDALRATTEAHKKDLEKFLKVRNTFEDSRMSQRMRDMMGEMAVVVPKMCIMPDSTFRPTWAAASLVGMAYYSVAIPLRIVVYVDCSNHSKIADCLSSWDYSLIVDYLWDIFFMVDIVLYCSVFAYRVFENDEHKVVTDRRQIFKRFWRSAAAAVALLAAFPLDFLAIRWGYLLVFRLSKLLWTVLVFDKIAIILQYFEREKAAKLSTETITVLYLSVLTVLMTLWTTVLWAVLRLETESGGVIASLYWVFTTMTTVGFGDITPETNNETLFVVLFCIVGPSMTATIIANAASFLNSSSVSEDSIGHRQVVLKAFLGSIMPELDQGRDKVPVSVIPGSNSQRIHPVESKTEDSSDSGGMKGYQRPSLSKVSSMTSSSFNKNLEIVMSESAVSYWQVIAYLDYVENEKRGLDEAKLIATLLPDYMQHSLQQARVVDIVSGLPFFAKCAQGFIRDVVLALEVCFVPRHTTIFSVGDATFGCYAIKSGSVQIFTEAGRKYRKKTPGESFGEVHLLEEKPCKFIAESQTNCELLLLWRFRYEQLLRDHDKNGAMKEAEAHMQEVAHGASKEISINRPQHVLRSQSVGFTDINDSFFISSKSNSYLCWAILLAVLSMANILVLPARIAFMEERDNLVSYFMLLDYSSDFFHLLDIVLRSNFLIQGDAKTGAYSRADIRKKYLQGSDFKFHLLAAMPLDIILLGVGKGMIIPGLHLSMQQAIALYRLNKFMRCMDLSSHFALIGEKLLRFFSGDLKIFIRVGNLILAVVILAHVFGCLFFIVGNQQHLHGQESNWADSAGLLRNCSLGAASNEGEGDHCVDPPSLRVVIDQYVYSIYWATATLTTVGFGDISPVSGIEQTYAMMLFLLGTAAYTVIVTNLEDIVTRLDVTSYIFKNRQQRLHVFLNREKVPDDFVRKNALYYDKMWTLCRGAAGKEVIDFLPRNVYANAVTTVLKAHIPNLFFIRDQSTQFIKDVAARMVLQAYVSHDTIFRSCEAANVLYIIRSGDISMMNEATGQKYGKIYMGDDARLGSSEFFQRQFYKCTALASTDVLLFELTYLSFWEVVELHRLEKTLGQQLRRDEEHLEGLSTQLLVQKFLKNLNRGNNKLFRMEEGNAMTTTAHACIKPDSWTHHIWTVASIFAVMYIALSVPYEFAFLEDSMSVMICDCILLTFLAVDMYLRLRWFAVIEEGNLITDRKDFSVLYIERHLKFDIISMLPIAVISYFTTDNAALFALTRVVYMCRVPRLNAHFHDLLDILYTLTSNKYVLSPDKLRVVKIVMTICYLAHVTCCIICLIGIAEQTKGGPNWIDANEYSELSNASIYVRGYFWAIYTIVTVGFGSVQIPSNSEKVFAMGVMIIGAIICDAGITAILSSIIANADILSGLTRRSKEAMVQFCHSHEYTDSIKKKVALYYDYLSSNLQDSVEIQDFRLLSPPLQIELAELYTFDALCSLCLLNTDNAETQLGFVYSLLRHMVPTIAIPGQVILGVGGLDVHILRRGKAFARMGGLKCSEPTPGRRRDYYQVGEAVCREGRLNTSSPGKLVTVMLSSLEGEVTQVNENRSLKSIKSKAPPSLNRFISQKGSFFNSMLSTQPAQVYARISCGAKRRSTTSKPFVVSSSYESSVRSATWQEQFTFHVPSSATSVKLAFFDEKQSEDDGYMGTLDIIFAQMDERADFKTIVTEDEKEVEKEPKKELKKSSSVVGRVLQRMYSSMMSDDLQENKVQAEKSTEKYADSTDKSDRTEDKIDNENINEVEAESEPPSTTPTSVIGKSAPGTSHVSFTPDMTELDSFSKDSDDDEDGICLPPPASDVFMYHMREEVKNKSGKVHGNAEVKVTIKGGTTTDYSKGNKAKVFARNKQLSTTPTEAVAESFCHLFTLSWDKLTEMRNFYDPIAKAPCSTASLSPLLSSSLGDSDKSLGGESSSVEELQEAFKLPSKRRSSKVVGRGGGRNSSVAIPELGDIVENDGSAMSDSEDDKTTSMTIVNKRPEREKGDSGVVEMTLKDVRRESTSTDLDSCLENDKGSNVRTL